MSGLILSIFPGIGVWEIAFQELGYCVVRGPEILLGHDLRKWSPAGGKFDGVIGGIPCQAFSRARRIGKGDRNSLWGDMTPEYNRIVREAKPKWWLSENVPEAPLPDGANWNAILDAANYGATQRRRRRFCSNLSLMPCPVARLETVLPTVTATEHKVGKVADNHARGRAGRALGRRLTLEEMNEAFGMPGDFALPALKVEMHYHMMGNAVPLPMARALAQAIHEKTVM